MPVVCNTHKVSRWSFADIHMANFTAAGQQDHQRLKRGRGRSWVMSVLHPSAPDPAPSHGLTEPGNEFTSHYVFTSSIWLTRALMRLLFSDIKSESQQWALRKQGMNAAVKISGLASEGSTFFRELLLYYCLSVLCPQSHRAAWGTPAQPLREIQACPNRFCRHYLDSLHICGHVLILKLFPSFSFAKCWLVHILHTPYFYYSHVSFST